MTVRTEHVWGVHHTRRPWKSALENAVHNTRAEAVEAAKCKECKGFTGKRVVRVQLIWDDAPPRRKRKP